MNFADGRIKGYGVKGPNGREKKFYARYVRGPAYGENDFVDNGDGRVRWKRPTSRCHRHGSVPNKRHPSNANHAVLD